MAPLITFVKKKTNLIKMNEHEVLTNYKNKLKLKIIISCRSFISNTHIKTKLFVFHSPLKFKKRFFLFRSNRVLTSEYSNATGINNASLCYHPSRSKEENSTKQVNQTRREYAVPSAEQGSLREHQGCQPPRFAFLEKEKVVHCLL